MNLISVSAARLTRLPAKEEKKFTQNFGQETSLKMAFRKISEINLRTMQQSLLLITLFPVTDLIHQQVPICTQF
jgi:hypothetical protein